MIVVVAEEKTTAVKMTTKPLTYANRTDEFDGNFHKSKSYKLRFFDFDRQHTDSSI